MRDVADVGRRLPRARSFAFDGLMPSGTYGMVAADKKTGKSLAMLDRAIATARGVPLFGEFA